MHVNSRWPPAASPEQDRRFQVVGAPRVKGNALNGAIAFMREEYPDGWRRAEPEINKLMQPAGDMAAVSAWYDLALLMDVADVICREAGDDPLEAMYRWGRYTIERDMRSGLYRAFLRAMPPSFVFPIYGVVWRLYHESGKIEVLSERPRQVRLLCYGLAHPNGYLLWHAVVGGARRILELCGTPVQEHAVVAGGKPGDPFLEFELRWRNGVAA